MTEVAEEKPAPKIEKRRCRECHEKKPLIESFYRCSDKRYWETKCKACSIKWKAQYQVPKRKNTGFAKLDKEIKNKIIKGLLDEVSPTKIARRTNLSVQSLYYWMRTNKIPKELIE